ncbi:MAG: hypothetical protein U1E76_06130 [Planctomycetota bacterium]
MRSWLHFFLGESGWSLVHVLLALAFLTLMLVLHHACKQPSGPSAVPMIMMGLFYLAWCVFFIASPINAVLWARTRSLGWMSKLLLVPASFAAVSVLFVFLIRASDPNYPQRLLRGRVLFVLSSIAIYVLNLAALWLHRGRG